MSSDVDSFTEWASQPFRPNHTRGNGQGVEVGERVAEALEYIAAQLGDICRKMEHGGSGYGATKQDFEQMNERRRKL